MEKPSITFTCVLCNEPFDRPYSVGRQPRHCRPCKAALKRERQIANHGKTYVSRLPGVPETFICPDCNQPFQHLRTQGKTPARCRPCRQRRANDLTTANRRVNGRSDLKFAPGERRYPCQDCGREIQCAVTGRKPLRCTECNAKVLAERNAAKPPRPPRQIVCIDCNTVMTIQGRGSSVMKRCSPCAKKKARAIQKRMAGERRALMRGAASEKFEDREIFERDRWRCQLCRKRISKNLKHPHPMSASLDHIIPLTKGGSHTRAGVQASHLTCNLKKYNLGGGEQLLLIG